MNHKLKQIIKEEIRKVLSENRTDMFKSLKVGETVKYMGEDHKIVEKDEAVATLQRIKTGKTINLNSNQVNEKVRRAQDFMNEEDSSEFNYGKYIQDIVDAPSLLGDLELGVKYDIDYRARDNYGDKDLGKITISITQEDLNKYGANTGIQNYLTNLFNTDPDTGKSVQTGYKVTGVRSIKKASDKLKTPTNENQSGNFNSFIESYTNYLKNISREEMFDKSGNYNSTLKGYHDTLKQYAKSGTEEEQLKANFLLGFM